MEGEDETAVVIGSRDAALALLKDRPKHLRQKRVQISNGIFIVQELPAAQQSAFEKSLLVGKGRNQEVNTQDAKAKMVARCVVDATGARIFTDQDVPFLGTLPSGDIDALYAASQELSEVSDSGVKDEAEGLKNGQSPPSPSA